MPILGLPSIFSTATPSMAQFVVIKGRYIPSAWYKAGLNFWIAISINWTKEAITRINDIVLKYVKSGGVPSLARKPRTLVAGSRKYV